MTCAPLLATAAMSFGPAEYFALAVFALTVVATLSSGAMCKGLAAAFVGLFLSTVGIDPVSGDFRNTFDVPELFNGISLVPALVGLFAVSQVLLSLEAVSYTHLDVYKRQGPMLVSDPWFRKLDPQTKALVEKAAKEAAAYEWKWSAEQDEIALKECLARGMVINDVSDEPAWTEAARSVWPQFYDKVGGKAVVDEALAIMQQ